jgi:hypothetical protein
MEWQQHAATCGACLSRRWSKHGALAWIHRLLHHLHCSPRVRPLIWLPCVPALTPPCLTLLLLVPGCCVRPLSRTA